MEVARVIRYKIVKCRFNFVNLIAIRRSVATVSGAKCGKDEFLENYNDNHLETSQLQKTLLGFGSAVVSLADPRRGDMIAALGETTGIKSLKYVRSKMQESEEGRRILCEKPRITSTSVDLKKLENLKNDTVGKAYYKFLKKYNYTPDARLAVRFVDDIELAYIIQRYREVHDLFHTILDMPTNMLGEVTVKWVEAMQTRLPMCIGGALFGAARLAPKYCRHYSTLRKTQVKLGCSFEENTVRNPFKKHPGVLQLQCIEVPQKIQDAFGAILNDRNLPDAADEAQKLRNYLHSRKPPQELEELRAKKKQFLEEVQSKFPLKNPEASEDEIQYTNQVISGKVNYLMRSRNYHWIPLVMNGNMCYYYLLARTAADYAVIRRVFNEIHRRDPTFSPKNIFDFGSGVGTVSWVAHELWAESLKEYFTVDASPDMNDLARLILQFNNPQAQPFVRQLFQRQFLPSTPRQYDLVVSAFSLMELDSVRSRVDTISNLWAKTNKYLVIMEQGTNSGFQLVNEARDLILHLEERAGQHCHVFAPCPHEMTCPRASLTPPTPCNFTVNYAPLKYLLRNPSSRQERFSFVIMKRGERGEGDTRWPRIVREVLHRHKHVVCRMCTASGRLEEVIFTASKHGKNVFKCAKYSSWGDLIPGSLDSDNPSKESESNELKK